MSTSRSLVVVDATIGGEGRVFVATADLQPVPGDDEEGHAMLTEGASWAILLLAALSSAWRISPAEDLDLND